MKKRTLLSKSFLNRKFLAVPAAALMLGAAHAGTTVGLNFQAYYYDSHTTPQTVGYGKGYQTTGFPVTATAFGVAPENWSNTDPLFSAGLYNGGSTAPIVTNIPFGGTLTASVTTPNVWESGIGEQVAGFNPETVAPGNNEVTWGYLDDGAEQWNMTGKAPAVSVSGLAAKFPNGYVIETIAAVNGSANFTTVDFSNGATTNKSAYSTYAVVSPQSDGYDAGGTVGVSAPSSVFTSDTINIRPEPESPGHRSVLAGFIVTDQPVISQGPVGGGSFASGGTFSLSATAWGIPPLRYQWRTNGVPIAGATNAVYTQASASVSDTANYDLVITNVSGTTTSSVTSVTIVSYVTGTNAVWINSGGGSWTVGSDWTNGIIGNGVGASANFSTLTLPSDAFVTLDTGWAIGNLTFGDVGNLYTWEIDPGTNGALTLAATGTPAITVLNQTATITAPISGTDGLSVNGAGTLMLSDAAYTGPTTVNGDATLVLTNDSGFTSPVLVNSGATLQVLGNGFTLPASVGITLSNSTLIGTSTSSGRVFIDGPITVLSSATLLAENPTAYQVRPNGGLFGTNANLTIASTDASEGGFQFNGPNGNFSGNVVVSNIVINVWTPGPNIFAQANVSLVSGGEIELGNNTYNNTIRFMSLSGDSSGIVGCDNGANTLAIGTNNGSGSFPGTIMDGAGSGPKVSFLKEGAGTEVLTGDNTYTGPTTVNGGTLEVDGSLSSGTVVTVAGGTLDGNGIIGGAVNVLSGGTLTVGTANLDALSIGGPLVLAGDARFFISKTGGTLAENQIQGLSSVTYGGTLTLSNITSDASQLVNGDTFQLFSAGSFNGEFASFELPALSAGLSWSASQLQVNGSISVINATDPPVFAPAPGGSFGPQTVTIRCLTPGAIIYYTTNGSVPTTSSPQASSGFTIDVALNEAITINAFAQAPGVSASAVVSGFYVSVPDAVWTSLSGGSWGVTNDWADGIIGQGIGVTADFSKLTLTSDTFVTLDSSWTIGNLIFGDMGSNYTWEIDQGAGGTLTLAATNPPTITVLNQTSTITTPVAGTNGLIKTGNGALVFTGTGIQYTGTSTVNGGTLGFMDNGNGNGNAPVTSVFLGSNSALTFTSSGAASDFRGSIGGTGTVTVNGTVRFGPWGSVVQITNTSGDIVVASGTLQVAGRSNYRMFDIPGNLVVSNGAEVSWNALNDLSPNTGSIFGALVGDGILSGDYSTPYASFGNSNASGTFSGVIQNSLSITKIGTGTQVLTGPNTYTGTTTVSGGVLQVNGSLGTNTVTVQSGGTLSGNGTIGGPVTIQSGGTLMTDPASINVLMIDNSVNLAGNVNLRINSALSAEDQLAGLTSITFGGTLTVTNLAGTLAVGEAFQLFDATNYAGNFTATNLPILSGGLAWNWNPANGTLSVVTAGTAPVLSGTASFTGHSFSLSFSGPNGQGYSVISSTNLALPLADWTTVTTGTFGSGAVNFTDTSATNKAQFYRIESP